MYNQAQIIINSFTTKQLNTLQSQQTKFTHIKFLNNYFSQLNFTKKKTRDKTFIIIYIIIYINIYLIINNLLSPDLNG